MSISQADALLLNEVACVAESLEMHLKSANYALGASWKRGVVK